MDEKSIPVITSQPGSIIYREWNDGLCGCGNDIHTCLCVFFCYSCQICLMYRDYGECCCAPLIVPASEFVLGTQHRARQRIKGGIASDCCQWIWCSSCYVCRLRRDMNYTLSQLGTLI
ncbi:hypothetical protein MN116_001810 [Schistosoma mekongi]|uniref:Uncharacterized protein n=1 Tax=Schistosoma mekongi TaxID=38744 RepID=A0AAE1ZIE6_SCHME|nr:hypothetical protein MN116_001810 [Schistosoma mekongi]